MDLRIAVFTNTYKDKDLSVTGRILSALAARGVECLLHRDAWERYRKGEPFDTDKAVKADMMVSVGGDGTMLRIAKYCAAADIPVLGVNLGFTGFLTELEPDGLEQSLHQILDGAYTLEKRELLEADCNKQNFLALNDIVVLRDSRSRMPELELLIGGAVVDRYHCDGFIVSTPTGSTAYSLSAGGPIISPTARAFALTPITPHSLHSRPLVVSDEETVHLRLLGEGITVKIEADGCHLGQMRSGETLSAKRSPLCVSFVRTQTANEGFYSKLYTKLNKWSSSQS